MNTLALYEKVCLKASRSTTHSYSTSFSLGIRSLDLGALGGLKAEIIRVAPGTTVPRVPSM